MMAKLIERVVVDNLWKTILMDHNYIWDKTKSVLRERLPAHAFETWFEPVKPLYIKDTKLVLQVPNQFFFEWLDTHYKEIIEKKVVDKKGTRLKLQKFQHSMRC